jgi:electron transport complex protein RnfA
MADTFPLLIGAAFTNNFIVSRTCASCPFFGAGGRVENAVVMAGAVTTVLTVSAFAYWLIDRFLLAPFDVRYLSTVVCVAVIVALAHYADVGVRARHPQAHRAFGRCLPLITMNCALTGSALLASLNAPGVFASVGYALAAAVGFTLLVVAFCALQVRVDAALVPAPFRGAPAALVGAGLMSLAFMGFRGLGS